MRLSSEQLFYLYLNMLLMKDRVGAWFLIESAIESGSNIEKLYLQVIEPAQKEIGELWAYQEITSVDEHAATEISETICGCLYRCFVKRKPSGANIVLVACPPTEQHHLGARILSDFLESRNFPVALIGPSTPEGELVDLTQQIRPKTICLSVAAANHIRLMESLIDKLRTVMPSTAILVGGNAHREAKSALTDKVDGYGETALDGVDLVRKSFAGAL